MKIAVLNECFLTNSHLQKLKALGELLEYKDTTTEDLAIERLKDVDIALADGMLTPLTQNVFNNTNNLKLIVLNTTGFDAVDLETATQKGIKIANAGNYSTEAVAEHTIALMLAVAKKIVLADRHARLIAKRIREMLHSQDPEHQHAHNLLGFELKGKTLGIVGLGNIGCRVAEIGNAFGMNVIAFNRSSKDLSCVNKQMSLDELLKESDVVSLHLPLNKETENIISQIELDRMKPSAILINTARGKLVNSENLYEALTSGKIAGAGLDVLDNWSSTDPLFKLENVVITPHSAFFTQESLNNLADILVENIESFIKGDPINIVNS